MREQRPHTQHDEAFRYSPEERKLICDMAAWSGLSKQNHIIAKLTDTQVEARPSVGVRKALKDSMAELTKEVRLAASYGELTDSMQRRIELVMRFFLALGGPVDALSIDNSMKSSMAVPETLDVDTDGDTSIFDMGRG